MAGWQLALGLTASCSGRKVHDALFDPFGLMALRLFFGPIEVKSVSKCKISKFYWIMQIQPFEQLSSETGSGSHINQLADISCGLGP